MISRRSALALGAAALALPRALRAEESGLQLGKAEPFRADGVVERARALAAKPYREPRSIPQAWLDINYDQYRKIWFDHRNALWRGTDRPAQVEVFPPGLYFPHPVEIYAVEPATGTARPLAFDMSVFDTTDKFPDLPADDSLGYSGLRLLGELETPGQFQEYAVFQGASYFRAIGAGQIYGISARGIAVGTASDEGEEFPAFRAFWVEAPEAEADAVIMHALLDGPSVTGAYRFAMRPGEATVMDVEAVIFPRRALDNVGLAAETSMFFFDETNRHRFNDFRPAVHDSDGLAIWNGMGERLWRPLKNPSTLQISSFVDENPRGFGLMQRARKFSDFADFSAKYHRRPGLWVEPLGEWGRGSVTLVEIPTDKEIYDNIVAYWRPREPLARGAEHRFAYRLTWGMDTPDDMDRARIINTRMGPSFSDRTVVAVDFEAHEKLPDDLSRLTLHTSGNRGRVTDGILQRNPETGGVRLDFGIEPPENRSQEIRAQLVDRKSVV